MKTRHRHQRHESTETVAGRSIDLDAVPVAMLLVDANGAIRAVNKPACTLLQRHTSELVGCPLPAVLGKDLMWNGRPTQETGITLPLPSGERLTVTAIASSLPLPGQPGLGQVVLIPFRAPTTLGAPMIRPWLEVADRIRQIPGDSTCAVIGLTGLQAINVSFSRSTGDAVLSEIAHRLSVFAPIGAVIERIAGDRLVVAMPAMSTEAATAVLRRLSVVASEPIETALGRVAVGCSIGATTGVARQGLVLIDRADHNLSVALGHGPGRIELNDEPRVVAGVATARLSGELRSALTAGSITPHFQPVVDLDDGRVVEIEAFARWTQPGGNLAAADFISTAYDTGAAVDVSLAVMDAALDMWSKLPTHHQRRTRVSINTSAQEIEDPRFVAHIRDRIGGLGTHGDGVLQIEVVRPISSDRIAPFADHVHRLQQLGVRVALDNLGTDPVNLLVFRDVRFDAIKINVGAILPTPPTGDGDTALRYLDGLFQLANRLGVHVTAKGVEYLWQRDLVRQLGCHTAQGYLFGRPVNGDDLTDWLTTATDDTISTPTWATATDTAMHRALSWHGHLDTLRAVTTSTRAHAAGLIHLVDDHQYLAANLNMRLPTEMATSTSPITATTTASLFNDLTVTHPTSALARSGWRSLLTAPVRRLDTTTVARLCAVHDTPAHFDATDLEQITLIAELCGHRLEHHLRHTRVSEPTHAAADQP